MAKGKIENMLAILKQLVYRYKEEGIYTPALEEIANRYNSTPKVKVTVRSLMHCFWAQGKHPRKDKDIKGRLEAFSLLPEALENVYKVRPGRKKTDRGQNIAWQLWSKVGDKDIYMIVEQYPDGSFVLFSIRFGK